MAVGTRAGLAVVALAAAALAGLTPAYASDPVPGTTPAPSATSATASSRTGTHDVESGATATPGTEAEQRLSAAELARHARRQVFLAGDRPRPQGRQHRVGVGQLADRPHQLRPGAAILGSLQPGLFLRAQSRQHVPGEELSHLARQLLHPHRPGGGFAARPVLLLPGFAEPAFLGADLGDASQLLLRGELEHFLAQGGGQAFEPLAQPQLADEGQFRGGGGRLVEALLLLGGQLLQPGGIAVEDGPEAGAGGGVGFVQLAVELPQLFLPITGQGVERLEVVQQSLVVLRVGPPALQTLAVEDSAEPGQ